MKLSSLFPVQKQIVPLIQDASNLQSIFSNDLCVLAPTGSGKTFTYVLPIVKELSKHIRPATRAIILAPVGDLAEQVYQVVNDYIANGELNGIFDGQHTYRPLKTILLSNKSTFIKEQNKLIDKDHKKCLFDIIISTPGRLVDHIQKTCEFELNELRYLVIDECDRIVEHIKQNWLDIINQELFVKSNRKVLTNDLINVKNVLFEKNKLVPVQKLLLSATLTRNPEKLEQLNLFQPLNFNVTSKKTNDSVPIDRSAESGSNPSLTEEISCQVLY